MRRKKLSKHDQAVKRSVAAYKGKKYKVEAAIPGFKSPPKLGKYKPDLIAKKGRDKVVIEVETSKSMKTDQKQRAGLKRQANKKNMRFRVVKSRR